MRLLITGRSSYIGNAVEAYLQRVSDGADTASYVIRKISLRGADRRQASYADTDCILHVAGIAHSDVSGVSEERKKEYYDVNCDLAVETAKKAKAAGVKQFIYLSSVIVYGESAGVGRQKHITKETQPAPANFYGDSKWQAEQRLQELAGDGFAVAIVRPPMVYGRGSKGNFPILCKLADRLPVFPKVDNARSMIYIENLAEFLRLLMEDGGGGLFLPQDERYYTTSELVAAIRKSRGKKMLLVPFVSPLIKLASRIPGKIGALTKKAFGSLTVDRTFGDGRITGYRKYTLEESLRRIHES